MIRIQYRKHFISGLLAGITVDEFVEIDQRLSESYVEELFKTRQASPARDAITGDEYWVSRVAIATPRFQEREAA